MRKSFAGPVDQELLEYCYATSHQPGAHHAPLAFIAGELFPKTAPQQIYAKVSAPVLVLYDRDPHTSFAALDAFAQQHPNYQTHASCPAKACRRSRCRRAPRRARRTTGDASSAPMTGAG